MTPDAIIVFSGGTVPYEEGGETRWRTTTYDNVDAFGTMGGRERVDAVALLAKKCPQAYIVATSKRMTGESTTLAEVYAAEIEALGVPRERIIQETVSTTAANQVREALRLAGEKGWQKLIFLSSEFQLPRIMAFYGETDSNIRVEAISSESVLIEHDPSFALRFEEIKQTDAYQTRLASEARGIAAIKAGTYKSAPPDDKRER
jgi:hypothetical protein